MVFAADNRIIVLDRDGTINVEKHYLSSPDEIELLPNAVDGMLRMQQLGLTLMIVTNQSGVGRGIFNEQQLMRVHARLVEELKAQGVQIAAIYSASDHPDFSTLRRKPAPGMLLEAAAEFEFEPATAVVIGDKACDIDMGRKVGATTILVRTGHGRQTESENKCRPDYIVDDLMQVARLLEHSMPVSQKAG